MDVGSLNQRVCANAATLEKEIAWCCSVMDLRFELTFAAQAQEDTRTIEALLPQNLETDKSEFASIIKTFCMGYYERMVLIMALIPHVRPEAFDLFTLNNAATGKPYTQFGGVQGKIHKGFLPTLETVAFVLAGNDLEKRMAVMSLFDTDHYLRKKSIIKEVF